MTAPGEARLRRAGPADLDALVAVEAAAGATDWSRAQLREELERPDGHVWLAELEGAPAGGAVGCAVGWAVAGEVHVLLVAVAPDARRRGLGRRLLEALCEGCGGGPALLEVRASNTPALGLYRSAGFTVVGRRPRYYPDGEDAVLMTREEE